MLGYELVSNKCVKISTELCLRKDPVGSCIICSNGIYAMNGKCNSDNLCNISNCSLCTHYQGVSMCLQCQHGYALSYDTIA
jgi:hypothetical protein